MGDLIRVSDLNFEGFFIGFAALNVSYVSFDNLEIRKYGNIHERTPLLMLKVVISLSKVLL